MVTFSTTQPERHSFRSLKKPAGHLRLKNQNAALGSSPESLRVLTPAPSALLVKTAKANEIQPQAYLKNLFERFPAAQTTEDMCALIPQYEVHSILPSLSKQRKK